MAGRAVRPYLLVSPYTSLYLPIPPYTSLYPPTSPYTRCAAEFIQCDEILKPIRNSIFSGILVFANQAQGKAEP